MHACNSQRRGSWLKLSLVVTVSVNQSTTTITSQRKAARFVKGDFGRESSVTAMLDDLEWPTLASRRKAARVTMFNKAVNRDVDLEKS